MAMTERPGGDPAQGRGHSRAASAARRALAANVRAGATTYDRRRDLPALVRSDPFCAPPQTCEAVAGIVGRLERALRAERRRARSGHWTYDLNRHIALRQAFLAETELLTALRRGGDLGPGATMAES